MHCMVDVAVPFHFDVRARTMVEDSEIAWHKEQIAKNRTLLEDLEASNVARSDQFPKTQSEIEHLKAQITQSELS
jgi:hypothetical protein